MQFLFHVNQSHFHKNGARKLGNGLFDLNTLRVDGKIFESGKKRLRIQKYPDRCGGGLSREFPHKKIIFILLDSLTFQKIFIAIYLFIYLTRVSRGTKTLAFFN